MLISEWQMMTSHPDAGVVEDGEGARRKAKRGCKLARGQEDGV